MTKQWTDRERFLIESSKRSLEGRNVMHSHPNVTPEDIERDKKSARTYLASKGFSDYGDSPEQESLLTKARKVILGF